MGFDVTALPWLPEPGQNCSAEIASIPAEGIPPGPVLQKLATAALTRSQSLAFGRAMKRCRNAQISMAPLGNFRLGVTASSTIDLILDFLPAAGARHGVALELVVAPYDQVVQQALNPQSELNASPCDAILMAVDHSWFQVGRPNFRNADIHVEAALERLESAVEAFRRSGHAAIIIQTIAGPAEPLFGSSDARIDGTPRAMVRSINDGILKIAKKTSSYVLDVAALAEQVGTTRWFDPVQWSAYKLPFSSECIPLYSDWLGRLIGSIRGLSKKCLVLDLDNTVWGGVIGDDGLEGIKVGQGNPVGEAFLAIQHYALDLKARGIILAVCSKNDDENARAPFRQHPDMALKESDIAVFQANWLDKPSNLEAIARTLNIGIDALVMLDDNPAERAMIRAALPMVALPELPSDPSWFTRYLAASGYFEAVAFSAEDKIRAESYAADAQRAQVKTAARDLGEYLSSLEMVLTAMAFDPQGRARISQLINKTNQFNVATKRYTEQDVENFEADPNIYTMQVRLADKFGDLGMIGVVIAKAVTPAHWSIDTWLMSCRVLGRRVEDAMLARLAADAKAKGAKRLTATYIPTAKNGMVKNLFDSLGFRLIEENADGIRSYDLDLSSYACEKLPFRAPPN